MVKDGMLAGWLTGEQAGAGAGGRAVRGGHPELESQGGGAAVRGDSRYRWSCVPEFSGERLTGLELACRLSLRAEESWGEPEPAELCAAAEGAGSGPDLSGAGAAEGLERGLPGPGQAGGPRRRAPCWNALRAQWPEVFPELEIQVTVQASLLAA